MDPFADNNYKQEVQEGNSVESETLDFNSTQMTLKEEIEEEIGDYGIFDEELAETNMAKDAVPGPSERTQLQFSTATTESLLQEYRKRINKFCDKTIDTSLIWDEIVNEFYKMNYCTTVDQLSEEFQNLKKIYFDVKGNESVTWQYFKTFSEIMKAEEENRTEENFTDDQQLINKSAVSPKNVEIPNMIAPEIKYKFKNATTLKRQRGRPPKIKRLLIRYPGVKSCEIKKEKKMSHSTEVNHEMKIDKSKRPHLQTIFTRINNKFMKMTEKRKRGRPMKKTCFENNPDNKTDNSTNPVKTEAPVLEKKLLPIDGQEIKVENNIGNNTHNSNNKVGLVPNPVNKKIQAGMRISKMKDNKRAGLPFLKIPGINCKIKKMFLKRGRPPKTKRLPEDGEDVNVFKNKTNNSTNLVAHSTCPEKIKIPETNSTQPKILAVDKDNETNKNNKTEKFNEMCISPGIVSHSLVSPEILVTIPNINDELIKNKRDALATSKFSGMDYKFKPLKRTRGRPPKIKHKPQDDIKNKTNNSKNLVADSTYPVNIEIPQTNSTQQRILSTDKDNETEHDKEMCTAPEIVSPSLVSQEIPAAIANINDELIKNDNNIGLPTSKFPGMSYKLKKAITLKRTRGRPPKVKLQPKDRHDVKVIKNDTNNSTNVLAHSTGNIEIPEQNSTQTKILATDKDNETEKDNKMCFIPGILSSSLISPEILVVIPNINGELIKNKLDILPKSKFSGMDYKFKPLKRTRGRPPKIERKRQDVFKNKTNNSTNLEAHSTYPVNIEIPQTNSTQQRILSTGNEDNEIKTDKEMCIAPGIISPSPIINQEIPAAIPNMNNELLKNNNEHSGSTTLKFSGMNYKFMKPKRTRGRPPKKKRPPKVGQNVNVNSTQQRTMPTNPQNINDSKIKHDDEICIAPSIVSSSSPVNKEILNEYQKRLLLIEEEKCEELRKLRLALQENTIILQCMFEKLSNPQCNN